MQIPDPIPRQWDGEAVVLIASGPSLCDNQIEAVKRSHEAGKCRAIAVNNTYECAPWADILYACDAPWWEYYKPDFAGEKWTQSREAYGLGVRPVLGKANDWLSFDPVHINNGQHSGFQALNLAVLFGAAKIILIGYDVQATGGRLHWHDDHSMDEGLRLSNPYDAKFAKWRDVLDGVADQLCEAGITCINASAETALTAYRRMPIEEALAWP